MNCYFPEYKTEGVEVGLHAHAQALATAGGRLQNCSLFSSERSSGLPVITQPVIVTLEHRPGTPTSQCQALLFAPPSRQSRPLKRQASCFVPGVRRTTEHPDCWISCKLTGCDKSQVPWRVCPRNLQNQKWQSSLNRASNWSLQFGVLFFSLLFF